MEELLKADAEMATMSFLPHPRTMINSQFIDSSEALREFLDNAIQVLYYFEIFKIFF